MHTCFFIGHQDAPDSIQKRLNETAEHLVSHCRVTEFIVGHYGNFDRMAVIAVQRAIQGFPEKEVIAYLLEPYFPGDRQIIVPHYFEDIYYPAGMETVPKRFCIQRANQKALNSADYLVAYVCREGGNAAKLLRSAKRLERQGNMTVINIAQK